ncbi:hypothetical protein CRYUN_Cryun05aG0110800 [Craigia yunnanensis]
MLFRLGIFLSLLSLFLIKLESAVSSIDLGSEWIKVAVVNLKPGQSPITVAINEMSKRKSPALVAFQSETRLLGEEAAGIIARYPDKVFSNLRDMVGKPYQDVKRFADSMYLPFDIVEDSRGAARIRVSDDVSYSVEELLGMILKYAANLAEFHSKVALKDAVILVPPYFGQAERRGLMTAAELAGINVISLINEHSGAALQYGIDKDFSNGSRNVIFYDMGSSSTYAALVYYSAYNAKEFGKTVSVNQFQVKDVRWDSELGGQNMELRLVEYFADEFNKQVGNGVDVRKSTITREKFEELCGNLWDKSLIPVKELLKHSGLQADDIYAVELIGGATRVPKLQVKLQEYFGRKDLDKHLDADEAIVLDGPDLLKDGATRLLLVPRMKKLPSKIFKSFNHSKDFEVSLAYDHEDLLPPGLSSPVFAQYAVSGLTDAADNLWFLLISHLRKPEANQTKLHFYVFVSEFVFSHQNNFAFSLSRSGILSLDQAEAVIQISEWIEVPKRNLTVENTTSPNVSVDVGTKNTSEKSNNSSDSDGGISNASNSSVEEPSTMDLGTERKLKKQTFKIPLKVVEKTMGPGISLSKESFSDAKRKLEALDKKDAERRRTAELKNSLEEYIYATKEKVQEWLYTDGEDATAREFQERLNLLKATADPIFFWFGLVVTVQGVEISDHSWVGDRQILAAERQSRQGFAFQLSINMDKFKTWLDEKEAEQKKMSGFSTPVFTSEEVYEKLFSLQDKAASIKRIPKPKPKVEKPIKNETETNSENAKNSDSTHEKDTSKNDEPAGDSDSSTNEEVNVESEPYDEL